MKRTMTLICALVLAIAIVGCGDDNGDAGTPSTNATGGQTSETGSTGPNTDGEATGETGASANIPDNGSKSDKDSLHACTPGRDKPDFKVSLLIGEPLAKARTIAKKRGYSLRTVVIDGEPQVVTMDYSPKRINIATVKDKVTHFCGIG